MVRAKTSAEDLLKEMEEHGFSSVRLEGARIVWGEPNHWECRDCRRLKRAASKRFNELTRLLRGRKRAALKATEPTQTETSVERLLTRMSAHGYRDIRLEDGYLAWASPRRGDRGE